MPRRDLLDRLVPAQCLKRNTGLELTTPLRKGERLQEKIEAQLARLKDAPRLVRSFFRAPGVAYITEW
ncbi:MAG: hypothetical protein ACREFD_09605 [Stellaceae bacterium]